MKSTHFACLLAFALSWSARAETPEPLSVSGRYPHLAMFNHNGECGTGAIAPWADRLWVITYGPHLPNGSDDKLYEIDGDLSRVTRPESVGGTPADRMIHRESNQLVIGAYFIDAQRSVRAISPKIMPGRLTAAARHLRDPANKVYILDMEGMLYEVDVHSLAVTKLFDRAAPGAHAKGGYTSQGRFVMANNGAYVVNKTPPAASEPAYDTGPEAAGALAEWDGQAWRIDESRQFTEVTTAGGLEGAPSPDAPLWTIGWDKRSVVLKVLDGGQWSALRLPKADDSYDGKHGWHTEWPRIRKVTPGKYLMNMHGGWFDFPKTMSASNRGGLRPLGSYLKITGDFAPWKDRIVFGCDDLALSDFGSGNLIAAGEQSESNLWFTRWEDLATKGAPSGNGGVWMHDAVQANAPSTPYLFAGYRQRIVHLTHDSDGPVTFTFETDAAGSGAWSVGPSVTVPAHGYAFRIFPDDLTAQWIRIRTDRDCASATAYFNYGPGGGAQTDRALFASLADAGDRDHWARGSVVARGHDAGTLLFTPEEKGGSAKAAAYEIDQRLKFRAIDPPKAAPEAKPRKADAEVTVDDASVIVTQAGIRYRLPKSDSAFDAPGAVAPRIREVVTERSLLNAHGSLYMLPRLISGGAQHLKPICTHDKQIDDFCSFRGLLVMIGARAGARPDGHLFASDDGKQGLWFGDIDDLWKLGKPRGHGGPWRDAQVAVGEPSDPYLMTGYDQITVELSHDGKEPIAFTVEVDFLADGSWSRYDRFTVPPGKTFTHKFPTGYSARWVRLTVDKPAKVTATFRYE